MRRRVGILAAAAAALLFSSPPEANAQPAYGGLTEEEWQQQRQQSVRWGVKEGRNNFVSSWGDLFYSAVYETEFIINNHCDSPEEVMYVFVDLPYLTIEGIRMPIGSITVPPGETRYPAKITTPPPPNIPILDPNAARHFFHGIYEEVKGAYDLTHVNAPPCSSAHDLVAVEGHIHFDPDAADDGPSGDPCAGWWKTGEKPAGATEATCLQRIRDLARSFREVVLRPLVEGDPQAWDWVPSTPEIGTMSIEALIAMKERADEGLAGVGPTDAVR